MFIRKTNDLSTDIAETALVYKTHLMVSASDNLIY